MQQSISHYELNQYQKALFIFHPHSSNGVPRIPICFIMKYMDVENISGVGMPLDYVYDLIEFLKNNEKYIELSYHGLTHRYKNHIGEFYCLDINKPVSVKAQKRHIEMSAKIFDYWNLDFPELFVPPFHAWESGVTDKILSEYGVKYLVSHTGLEYANHTYKWGKSNYLTFLPRANMGIWTYQTNLSEDMLKNCKKNIMPRTILCKLQSRRLYDKPVHSYMAHIGNFMPKNYDFWIKTLNIIRNKRCIICRNNKMAIKLYKDIVQSKDTDLMPEKTYSKSNSKK